jgi:hypothetical protein
MYLILRIKKMIRFFFGFMLAFGAMGGLDSNESLSTCLALAVLGLVIMAWGTFDKLAVK